MPGCDIAGRGGGDDAPPVTRARSYWGWGYADRFPGPEELAAIGDRVLSVLGRVRVEPRPPPAIEQARLPPAKVEPPQLIRAFCSAQKLDRAAHTYGKGYRDLARGFRGDFSAAPDFVAHPTSESEVEAVLEACGAQRIAVIPFGGGTSVVGGVEAEVGGGFAGVASLDMRGLGRVLEVDEVSLAARIQAGASGPSLEAELTPRGLTLRHFPQSFEFSTLGGWIATRAGGHFATLYTRVDDLVESTRMITPRGIWETRRVPSSGAGPSADRLVLGSEGVLGVITEAWVRVQRRPRWKVTASVHFPDWHPAVGAAREISQSGLYPSNCRLLDAGEALLNGVAANGSSVLVLGFESADHPVDHAASRALEIAAAHGGICPKGVVSRAGGVDDAAASWRSAFLEAPYLQNALVALGIIADTFETACTWDRFEALHGAVTEAVEGALRRVCGTGVLTCRFTHLYPDGPAPYFTFVGPGRKGAELEMWAELKRVASEAVLAAGGTITHHHGVGRLHLPWYERERAGPFGAALRAAKQAVDPEGILNPGVLLGGLR
ncbi:MAG: FAD-binding oxidoreductase [Myxococcales bacterium]|nr:FAD-binding oxidoreductase [Myxococcales bacterium]